MSDFKPNTCETCKHLVADNQYCKKFESFYVVNRPGDFEKKSKCWVPKSWFVEIARLERELAEQKEACKLAQEAALISCAQNEGFKKELAAARALGDEMTREMAAFFQIFYNQGFPNVPVFAASFKKLHERWCKLGGDPVKEGEQK